MTDVAELAAGTPAPDANVSPDPAPTETVAVETGNVADSSPAASNAGDELSKPLEDLKLRVNKVTRNWRETERERDYWREQALKAQPAEPAKPEAPAKIPALADFEYDESKYQAALLQYTESVAERKARDVLETERQRQADEQRVQTWKQRVEEFAKSKPDFEERVADPSLPITQALAQLIQSSDIGPELAYHLASNRDVLDSLVSKSGDAMALAVGKLEGRLIAIKELAARPAPKPQISQAPPPPPKLDPSEPAVEKNPHEMSDAEFGKWRRRQIAQRR